jgi:hypothetical protein
MEPKDRLEYYITVAVHKAADFPVFLTGIQISADKPFTGIDEITRVEQEIAKLTGLDVDLLTVVNIQRFPI